MTKSTGTVPDTVQLWYGSQVVGQITGVFLSDDTWFGSFHSDLARRGEKVPERVTEFIEFCQDWNNRVESSPNEPPHPAEFDQYSDLLKSGLWCVKSEQGDVWRISEAPVFAGDGEVSWRTD
jgi:hypothetical protein